MIGSTHLDEPIVLNSESEYTMPASSSVVTTNRPQAAGNILQPLEKQVDLGQDSGVKKNYVSLLPDDQSILE